MLKIAFRHLPFTDAQIARLDNLVRSAGYETVWVEDGRLPSKEELLNCEVLMGYFPPELISQLPALKWVQTPAAGVEKLCKIPYQNEDLVLSNCSGAFGIAIAEYMLTGLLMLMRNMPAYMDNQHRHIWQCEGLCRSIYDSHITVVGMGDIGRSFAARVKALGAKVRGVRRSTGTACDNFDEIYSADHIIEAVKGADAVVICLPGTEETVKIISEKVIRAMEKHTIVVNCGRGYTVDQEALIAALQEERICGAVLDVTAVEPLPANSPLWDMKNVILTPHISGHDDDPINARTIYAICEENLKHFLAGEALTHIVNRQRGY